jgi:hypothetical protein
VLVGQCVPACLTRSPPALRWQGADMGRRRIGDVEVRLVCLGDLSHRRVLVLGRRAV